MTILCYHEIDTKWRSPLAVAPRAFAEQMAWLIDHRRVLDLDATIASLDRRARLPAGTAAVTFDDGFGGVHEHAFPVLSALGIPATVFVVGGTLTPERQNVDWVRSPPPWPLRTIDRDGIAEMRAAGIRFGSHGFSHRLLPELSDAECEDDLRRSREVLEDALREPVRVLAYPGGRHDERVRRAAGRVGFTHAFALPERREVSGPFSIPRVGIYRSNDVRALRLKASRWYLDVRMGRPYTTARRLLGRPVQEVPG